MNTRELASRVSSNGQMVVVCFEAFKKEFEAMNRMDQMTDDEKKDQMKKIISEYESLCSAINGLKRSMEISRDPRFHRV